MLKIVFLGALFFGMPSLVMGQVIINEIAWMGTPVEGVDSKQYWRYEWLELYNVSDIDISVSGWKIELYRNDLDFVIPLQGIILAKEYFIIASSQKIDSVDINYATLAGKFTNSGQRVVLRDRAGSIVEEVNATSGWFAGDNDEKLTMERRFPDKDATDPENWGSSLVTGGSLNAENTIFQREAIINLDDNPLARLGQEKKSPVWAPFSEIFLNKVFIRAFLLSLLFAFAVLLLRRYLRSKDASSSDALQD